MKNGNLWSDDSLKHVLLGGWQRAGGEEELAKSMVHNTAGIFWNAGDLPVIGTHLASDIDSQTHMSQLTCMLPTLY